MNERLPLVSIIIPVYNAERYLRECLDSVLGQTLREIEVICVNDGSKDASLTMLREYEANDSRLRVIEKQNEGVSVARNTGLDAAQGEFVLFVDADDIVVRDLCEKACNKAMAENLDLIAFDYDNFEVDGTRTPHGNAWPKNVFSSGMNRVEKIKFLADQAIPPWTKFSRRQLLQRNDIRFPAGIANGEDCFFHWKVIGLAQNPGCLEEICYHYRMNPSSATHRRRTFSTSIVVYEMIENFLKEHGLYPDVLADHFFICKMGDYWVVLTQQYPDRKELAEAVAYAQRTTSLREVPLVLRSGMRWRSKVNFSLMILFLKTHLWGAFLMWRNAKTFFLRILSSRKHEMSQGGFRE